MKTIGIQETNGLLFDAVTGMPVLDSVLQLTQEWLQEFAASPEFMDKMQLAFGDGVNVASLQDVWASGSLGTLPEIEVRSAAEINGANGAFATATNTIYLAQELLSESIEQVALVFLEEYGHYVDSLLTLGDAPGDEGAIFAEVVRGNELSSSDMAQLQAENDTATVTLDGKAIEIEQILVPTNDPNDPAYIVPEDQKLTAIGNQNLIPVGFDVSGVVEVRDSDSFGSGVLLNTGRHILTAGHVAHDLDFQLNPFVYFAIPGQLQTSGREVESIDIHPSYNDNDPRSSESLDLAILTLSSPAPNEAESYELYRETDEIDKVGTLVGWGDKGTGFQEPEPSDAEQKRFGNNKFDKLWGDGNYLRYDFDTFETDGNSEFPNQFGGTGLGFNEVMGASGDSGAPFFIDGKIAGLHVASLEEDEEFAGQFGDKGWVTRISTVDAWIDQEINSELIVNTLNDEDDGIEDNEISLRDAIAASTDGQAIKFDSSLADGTINLTLGELVIDKPLTIQGLGADQLTVDGNGNNRVFKIDDGDFETALDVEISGLTITGGSATGNFPADNGGGIFNDENLLITNSVIIDNSATGSGGGIFNDKELSIFNSTIANNTSDFSGGGIENYEVAVLQVINSTVSGNSAANSGGGISLIGDSVTLSNSTISGNSAPDAGGIKNFVDTLTLTNSIIANNSNGDVVSDETINTSGVNLVEDGSLTGENIINQDPNLGSLQNNGGSTLTQIPQSGSPAVDAGDNNSIFTDVFDFDNDGNANEPLPFDQRGVEFPRIVNDVVDLGAVEVQDNDDPGNQGSVVSQGDRAMNADDARQAFSLDGSGITVGVISDSYNTSGNGSAEEDINSGDLPNDVNVLQEQSDQNLLNTDEGRALLQIIHDIAPGADLAFHTAGDFSRTAIRNAVRNLAEQGGADIIVDDVFNFAEPFFQDGIIAQEVDKQVAAGIPYFSSAGNTGQSSQSYEDSFRPGTNYDSGAFGGDLFFYGGISHDFDPGDGMDDMQKFTLAAGRTVNLELQWDDPFAQIGDVNLGGGTTRDLDFYILDPAENNEVVASSVFKSVVADNPVEGTSFTNDSDQEKTYNLMILDDTGDKNIDHPNKIKYIEYGKGKSDVIFNEFVTTNPTIVGHPNAAGAAAVGAVPYYRTPAFDPEPDQELKLEPFSSRGGTPILFDDDGNRLDQPIIRNKPEFVAPDGVNTTFFKEGEDIEKDDDTHPNFFGTSAAAPHAAAVAALMLQANPNLSPQEIYTGLANSAIDMNDPGFDFASGAGFIQADRAIFNLFSLTPTETPKSEGNSGTTPFTFIFTRPEGITGEIDFDYEVTGSGDNLADADDFGGKLPTGTVTFTGEETEKQITIDITGDTEIEPDEEFTLTLTSASVGGILGASATILNDDTENTPPQDFYFSTDADTYTPGETLSLTNAWVLDPDGTSDIEEVDMWLLPPEGNWRNVQDAQEFEPWSFGNEWASFDEYTLDLSGLDNGEYTLWGKAYDSAGNASDAYTTTFEINNTPPQNFYFSTDADTYTPGETLSLTNAWVLDPDGTGDIEEVDMWLLPPEGDWRNVEDAQEFEAWSGGNEWASFDEYTLDLSGLESGEYTLWGKAYDSAGNASDAYTTTFEVSNVSQSAQTQSNTQSLSQVQQESSSTSGGDELTGMAANDSLVTQTDGDKLTKSDSNDPFVYTSLSESGDVITDFQVADDQIVLTEVLNSLDYQGSDALADGYVRLVQGSSATEVQVDPDGLQGQEIFSTFITLEGVSAAELSASNFVF